MESPIRHLRTKSHILSGCVLGAACLTFAGAVFGGQPWNVTRQRGPANEIADQLPQANLQKQQTDLQPVKLSYVSSLWQKVLEDLAEATGSELVMDKVPRGRYTRRDRSRYDRAAAVRILNHDLEREGFRLLEKGRYLVLLQLDSARSKYRRPVAKTPEQTFDPQVRPVEHQKYRRDFQTLTPRNDRGIRQAAATDTRQWKPKVTQVSEFDDEPSSLPSLQQPSSRQQEVTTVVQTRRRSATQVARTIFEAYKSRASLIDDGPNGLPAFRVYRPGDRRRHVLSGTGGRTRVPQAATRPVVDFTVGIDEDRDALVVAAIGEKSHDVARLIRYLDTVRLAEGESLRLYAADDEKAAKTIKQLQPAIRKLVAMQVPGNRRTFRTAQNQGNQPQQPQPDQPAGDQENPQETDDAPKSLPIRIGALKGDVFIETLPNGVVIVRGNEADVEQVMKVIREIEKLSEGTVPGLEILFLRNVNSEALAQLLTDVYQQLGTAQGTATATTSTVNFIPVVTPNAIIILAPLNDMESIKDTADKLDQPVDPETEFQVFRLRNAIASQVVAMLEDFYPDGEQPGLATRVNTTADIRTNSIIVQASPRDMDIVARLIRKIDRGDVKSVSRMKIFKLKHALAEDLADFLNEAVQSVLNPPQTAGGQVGGAGGGAQNAQLLKEVKSVVLEFMAGDGKMQKLIRSGILSDIRVNADARTNSLAVMAPAQSMPLMAELIKQLDQPTSAVAEIKVFALENADAASAAELLDTLFSQDNQGAQGSQLGIQVEGAEDASSGLIPLRFSVDVRTNTVIAIGGADALRVVEAILLRLDESDIREREQRIIRLKNSFVSDVATAINDFLQAQRDLAGLDPDLVSNVELLEQEVIVVPEPVTNSLLISATPRYYDDIMRIVDEFDAEPAQVIIQALIVEVLLENTDEFGVELGFQDSVLFGRGIIDNLLTINETVTSPNGTQTTSQTIISQEVTPGFPFNNNPLGTNPARNSNSVGGQGLSNFGIGRVNGDLGFGGLVLSASSENVSVLIRALAAKRHVQILNRSMIRTMDNLPGNIHVGQSVPVVNGVTPNALGGGSPNTAPVEVGIVLNVTPRISPTGDIVIQTVATKSAVSEAGVPIFTDITTGNVIEAPIIDIAEATATVRVPSGQTIVLGGMITKQDATIERKVPWLGDIPIIGVPFRFDSTTTRRTELLIFLTPRIIKTTEDNEMIKQIETERMHFLLDEAEAVHGPILGVPAEDYPEQAPPMTPQNGSRPGAPPLPNGSGPPTTIMPQSGFEFDPPEPYGVTPTSGIQQNWQESGIATVPPDPRLLRQQSAARQPTRKKWSLRNLFQSRNRRSN